MASILILSDSLSYYGPVDGLAADDPRIWPNLLGKQLNSDIELFARIGWTTRDVWWALTQDPRIWAALPKADLVVVAIGGMDSLPSPLPTALREQIRYLRPDILRKRARELYSWLQPRLSPLGWPLALPPKLTADYLSKIYEAIHAVRPELPVIVTLPSTHASPYYGNVHPGRLQTTAAIAGVAKKFGLPTADFYPPTKIHFVSGDFNPDGIHWGFEGHQAIAVVVGEVAAPIIEKLTRQN